MGVVTVLGGGGVFFGFVEGGVLFCGWVGGGVGVVLVLWWVFFFVFYVFFFFFFSLWGVYFLVGVGGASWTLFRSSARLTLVPYMLFP